MSLESLPRRACVHGSGNQGLPEAVARIPSESKVALIVGVEGDHSVAECRPGGERNSSYKISAGREHLVVTDDECNPAGRLPKGRLRQLSIAGLAEPVNRSQPSDLFQSAHHKRDSYRTKKG